MSAPSAGTRGTTRQRLIESGLEAFLTKSYDGVGIQEICAGVGVPKGSFYHWFASKQEFGVAVVQFSTAQYVEWLRSALARDGRPPLERLRALLEEQRAYLAAHDFERPCLASKMGVEKADLSDPLRVAILDGQRQLARVLADCFAEAIECGDLPASVPPAEYAAFVADAIEGAITRAGLERSGEPLERLWNHLFQRY